MRKRDSSELNRATTHFCLSLKVIQYVMLVVLFIGAVIVPAYGRKMQVRESAGVGVNAGNKSAGDDKGTIVLDAGHGGTQLRK